LEQKVYKKEKLAKTQEKKGKEWSGKTEDYKKKNKTMQRAWNAVIL